MLLCVGNAEGRVSFGVECSRGNASTLECVFHSLKHSSITSSLSLLFTARLGDTSDLQSFIENLDRELAGINTVWWRVTFKAAFATLSFESMV